MRIGIDVRYLSHGLVGGVHTYVANFVAALVDLASDHSIYLYGDTKRPFELSPLPEHVTLRLLPYKNPLSTFYHDLFMWRQMEKDQLDVAHFTGNYGFGPSSIRNVVTLQDEINLLPILEIYKGHSKNWKTMTMMTYLHFCTRAAIRKADLVITISEYSKRQIARYSSINPSKIVLAPHACPTDMARVTSPSEIAAVRERLKLSRPFVLAEAFKNPGVIVRAWDLMPSQLRSNFEIVFFSRSEKVLPVVHKAIAAGDARLLVRPARSDLSALFSMTEVFVFPSWIEGFGIPILEAMTCGAPVIASNRGALPEVVGDAGWLMDAEDAGTLTRYLTAILTTPAEAECLRQRGYARAAQFSWKNTAGLALDSYRRVLESKA